jgi:hypothetical protein
MVTEFLGPFFIILVVGLFFHCAVRALVLLIQAGRDREEDTAAARAAVSKEARL